MHTLLLSDSHVAVDDGSGSLLSQQKQADFKMNTKGEKKKKREELRWLQKTSTEVRVNFLLLT
jgi:hypothetical protein